MILWNPEQVLQLLHIHTRQPLAFVVAVLLLLKVWLLIALLVLVVSRRLRRIISRWNNEARYLNHLRSIFSFVYSRGQVPVHFARRERYFFRRLVLSQMSVMEDEDLQNLQVLYERQGFLAEDLAALDSRFFWRRLAAIIRLETCQIKSSLSALQKKVEDPHDFVALAAMRAVSKFLDPRAIPQILDALSRRAPIRRDVYVEIISEMGREAPELVENYLMTCFDPFVAALCLEVLAEMEYRESLPAIRSLLTSSSDDVVEAAAKALGALGDSQDFEGLRALLVDPNQVLRAAALSALLRLKDPQVSWHMTRLKVDASVEVQRILFGIGESLND